MEESVNLLHLPRELLFKIFGYLSSSEKGKTASVCRAWKQLLYDPLLWRNANFKFRISNVRCINAVVDSLRQRQVITFTISHDCKKEVLRRFLDRSSDLVSYLDLSCCKFADQLIHTWITPSFTQLHCLDISHTRIKGANLLKLFSALPSLKQLKAEQLHGFDNNKIWIEIIVGVTYKTIFDLNIGRNGLRSSDIALICSYVFPNIRRLKINMSTGITVGQLHNLLENLPMLEHLDMSHITIMDTGSAKWTVPQSFSSINLAHIRGLCNISSFGSTNLTALDLCGHSDVDDQTVLQVVKELPNLFVLKISQCSKVTDQGANVIARNLVHLRVLFVDGVDIRNINGFIENVSCNLTQLHSFSCVDCNVAPSVLYSKLGNLLSLKYLRFRHADMIEVKHFSSREIVNCSVEALALRYFAPDDSYFL